MAIFELLFSERDIYCEACAHSIENVLRTLAESHQWGMSNLQNRRLKLYIPGTLSIEELQKYLTHTLSDIGKGLPLIKNHRIDPAEKKALLQSSLHQHLRKGITATIFGLTLLILSLAGTTLPFVAMILIGIFATGMILYTGWDSYRAVLQQLYHLTPITMDTLFSLSTFIALVISLVALCFPALGFPLFFDAALMIFGFRHLGKAIETSATQKITEGLQHCDALLTDEHGHPRQVSLQSQLHHPPRVNVTALRVGDFITLQAGDLVPVDSKVISQRGILVKDTIATGDLQPHGLDGNQLRQGVSIVQGSLLLQVTRTFENSYAAQLDARAECAERTKAPIVTATAKILPYFFLVALLLAIVSALVVGFLFNPLLGLQTALSVLVAACPCILAFVVPLAVKIGIHKAANHGMTIAHGAALQATADINTLVFDLNGTLTEGRPHVTRSHIETGVSEDMFWRYCHAIEKKASHPFATVICQHAQNKFEVEIKEDEIQVDNSIPLRSGIRAKINGTMYTLGNAKMMETWGIRVTPPPSRSLEHIIYLAQETTILGYIAITDPLRKDAPKVIRQLHNMGKKIHLCTGSSRNTALAYARVLGIPDDNVNADDIGQSAELPKAAYITQLKTQGRVAMIGDASNDSLALCTSDLGVAILSDPAHRVTQDKAGVCIPSTSFHTLPSLFVIAQQTIRNIHQNLIFSTSYNVIAMLIAGGLLLAVGVTLNPGLAAAIMILQTVLVLLNAYRFKTQPIKWDSTPHFPVPEKSYKEGAKVVSAERIMPKMNPGCQVCNLDMPSPNGIPDTVFRNPGLTA